MQLSGTPGKQKSAVVVSSLSVAALDTMRRYIGTMEHPPGSNRGGVISESNIAAIGVDGNPWCAAFLWRCWNVAALARSEKNPLWRTGSVSRMFKKANEKLSGLTVIQSKKIKPMQLRRGSIFGVGRKGKKLIVGRISPAHTGGVDSLTFAGYIATVEGNYNDAVQSVLRSTGSIDSYILYEQ